MILISPLWNANILLINSSSLLNRSISKIYFHHSSRGINTRLLISFIVIIIKLFIKSFSIFLKLIFLLCLIMYPLKLICSWWFLPITTLCLFWVIFVVMNSLTWSPLKMYRTFLLIRSNWKSTIFQRPVVISGLKKSQKLLNWMKSKRKSKESLDRKTKYQTYLNRRSTRSHSICLK